MPPRKTVPLVAIPATRDAAEQLAATLGERMRRIARLKADAEDAIARRKLQLKTETAEDEAAIRTEIIALATWFRSNADTLLSGDRKSVALAAGTVGTRTGNPSVKIEDEAELIAQLRAIGRDHLVVVEESVAKDALLRERADLDGLAGLTIVQEERFFFRPLDVETDVSTKLATAPGRAA